MNAYIYQAALLCEECAFQVRQEREFLFQDVNDSDQWPQGPYSDGGGEADSPQHCDSCNIFLENSLTSDGMEYVRERIGEWLDVHKENPLGTPVALTIWAPFYGIELP